MTVFVKTSFWHKGENFAEGVETSVFSTREKAIEEMKAEMDGVKVCFNSTYGNDYIIETNEEDYVEIFDQYYTTKDWWSCEIVEKEIQ